MNPSEQPRKRRVPLEGFYRRANLIAARAIIERAEKYDGAVLDWARGIVGKEPRPKNQPDSNLVNVQV